MIHKRQSEIQEAVRLAGIIGAGGGGFPTHVKISTSVPIDTVIANGSECEPLLHSDKSALLRHAPKIIEGVRLVMSATGAQKGYIAIKGHYQDVTATVEKNLPTDNSIELFRLDNYYPAGDEFLTVYDVTGRVIPEGGLPLHVGVVVCNVLSLLQITDAINGKPVTERPVTITGSVNNPVVASFPIGTPYSELIKLAGGTLHKDDILIDGGPMMGNIIQDPENGIAKTTSGVIAFPKDHFIIRMKQLTTSQMVKKSKAACCQCIRCSDLCPRNLIGHNLYPHLTMRTIDYNLSEPTDYVTSAFLCSQCGVCELIACDVMQLSPRKIYAEYRKLLTARGIKNPHTRKGLSAREELSYRKIPISVILKKLDLSQFVKPISEKGYIPIEQVRISLNRHTGTPARPIVRIGEYVRQGDVIAASPEGTLGSIYHASIGGTVINVADDFIEIRTKEKF